jgi:hypothetical protein
MYIANRPFGGFRRFIAIYRQRQIVDLAFNMNKIKTKYNALAQCKPESLSPSTALLAIYQTLYLILKMNRFLIISTLTFLTSCGQQVSSDKSKLAKNRTDATAEIQTTKTQQKNETEEIAESFHCTEFDFNSTEQQADSLLAYMEKAKDSNLTDPIIWEQKFFCAFPNSFKRMQSIFGYDDENGAAPLYLTENETYSYIDRHINSDVIGYFSELKSIPNSIYYEKYMRINIDGYWDADNINGAFGFYYQLVSDTETACKTLSKFSDEEVRSVFRFIFDGPHPKNEYNEEIFESLKPKIDTQNERLGNLLYESYAIMMAEEDNHGH